MKIKTMRIFLNFLLLVASLILSAFAGELLARSVLEPIDFLLPRLVADDFLLHRVEGYTGGHDAWGFRNRQKPKSADIVCIGNSMTYGISASAYDLWPAVLGRIYATSVYNMSLGGYGPIQYFHLMRTKAVELHPKVIIVGFYFGNDFLDVYNEVRFNKNWSAYGKFGDYDVKAPAFAYQPGPGKVLGGLRDWLSMHSVLYALLTRNSIFDFVRKRELAMSMGVQASNLITYRDHNHNVILRPNSDFLNMSNSRIKSAMEITKHVMRDMRTLAEKDHFRLIVALIPTKESVYGKLLDHAGYLVKYHSLADAIHEEDMARQEIISFLQQSNIEAVDLLPQLSAKVDGQDLYPLIDSHPDRYGYRVIAETLNNYLNSHR